MTSTVDYNGTGPRASCPRSITVLGGASVEDYLLPLGPICTLSSAWLHVVPDACYTGVYDKGPIQGGTGGV